ncbi:MAG: energy-coupling factor transporter transmembrane protein EcfT [Bacilli bacterium]|nr:energy-coupling factor transporter transmembrane protein EcfT [Bacilli bacterium]
MNITKYNPAVILIYFISNILITMLTKNPVFIMLSFVSIIIFSLIIKSPNKLLKNILFMFAIIIIATLTNPFFNSLGKTVIFTIGKTEFSLEAMSYGFFTALMIIAVVLWFRNYNLIMTSDKFLYLFSKYFPNLSLIISMVLKLIPELLIKLKDYDYAQKVIGIYAKRGFIKKLKNKFLILGSLFSYAIEDSLQSAISMKARGYGLKEKTHFTTYKFRLRDFTFAFLTISLTLSIFILSYDTIINFSFYPRMSELSFDNLSIISYGLFLLLANLASILHLKEKIKWHYLKSKIYHSPTL